MRQSPSKKKTGKLRSNSTDAVKETQRAAGSGSTTALVHSETITSHRPDLVTDLHDVQPSTPVRRLVTFIIQLNFILYLSISTYVLSKTHRETNL